MDQEQTEQVEQTSERDALIAAVREAGGTESAAAEVEAAERAAAEGAKTGEGDAPPAAEPTEDERLAAILKEREERHTTREDAKSYAARVKAEADAEKQRMIEEAKAEARREAEAEKQRLIAEFRGTPTAHLRTLAEAAGGVDKLVDTVNMEGSPEWKALQETREQARRALEEAKEGKGAREEIAKLRAELEAEKAALEAARVRQEYLTQHASEEKTPYLHARFEPEEIFHRSVAIAKAWAEEGLVYRKDFDDSTIALYLEKQSRERFEKLTGTTPAQQVSAGAAAKQPGHAPKVTANGSRTLSAATGSERRTSPKPLHELTPEQQREELIAEVAAARRLNPEAKT